MRGIGLFRWFMRAVSRAFVFEVCRVEWMWVVWKKWRQGTAITCQGD